LGKFYLYFYRFIQDLLKSLKPANMKYLTLIFILIFINFNYAQTISLSPGFELDVGESYKVLDASYTRDYYPVEGGKTVSIKRIKGKMILQLLDNKTLKELKRVDYRELSPESSYHLNFEWILQTKNKLYLFNFNYDKKDKNKKVEVREINTKTLAVKPPRVLFEAPVTARFLYINHSPNSSSLLLGYYITPSRKDKIDGSSKEFLYVFDTENLNERWKKVFVIPHQYNGKKKTFITGTRMNFLGLNDNNKISALIKNSSSNEYDLYLISEDEIEVTEKVVPLGEDKKEFQSNLDFTFFHNLSKEAYNIIYMTGKGIVSYQISSDGKLVSTEKHKYSSELITQYLSRNEKKNILKEGNENLNPISRLNIANEGTLFIGESQLIEETGNDFTSYKFKHLILTFLNLDGTLNWIKKIPKNQFATNSRGAPFDIGTACFLSKDKKSAYLFYQDDSDNLEIAPDGIPKEFKSKKTKGFLTLCKVNLEDGSYKKYLVADMSNVKGNELTFIEMDNIFQPIEGDNVFLMEVRIKNTNALMKITMKD
jgi:hypothetical protein